MAGRKGSRKLTNTERANLVVAKEMRGVTGKTTKQIAEENGVSPLYLSHLTPDNLPAESKKIYKKKMAKLEELAFATTAAALTKGKELIEQADNPKHLSGIAAVGKMADTVYRLETRQPTEISNTMPAETHALEFIKMLMEKMDLNAALDAFSRASLDPLVPEVRKLEIRRRIESGELRLLTP